jgi:hypothetical protein
MPDSVGVQSSFMGGDGRPLLEPGALFVDGNYALRFTAWCSVAGVTLALRSRFLRSSDGNLVDSGDQLAPTSDRLLSTTQVQLGVGFPLNVMVFALAGAPSIGQCFVQVQIVHGTGPATVVMATILQGYVTSTQTLSWPGSPIQASLDSFGAVVTVGPVNPAAGADAVINVPVNTRWQVLSVTGQLNTGGGVGNRNPSMILTDPTPHTFARSPFLTNVTATQTWIFAWMAGFGAQVANTLNRVALSLPEPAILLAGGTVQTETFGILPADQWAGVTLSTREWIDV